MTKDEIEGEFERIDAPEEIKDGWWIRRAGARACETQTRGAEVAKWLWDKARAMREGAATKADVVLVSHGMFIDILLKTLFDAPRTIGKQGALFCSPNAVRTNCTLTSRRTARAWGCNFLTTSRTFRWTCEAVGAWTDCQRRTQRRDQRDECTSLRPPICSKNSKNIIITLLKSRLLPRAHERSQTPLYVRVVHLHRAELDLIQTQLEPRSDFRELTPGFRPLWASQTCDDAEKYNLRRSQTSPRALTSPSVPGTSA